MERETGVEPATLSLGRRVLKRFETLRNPLVKNVNSPPRMTAPLTPLQIRARRRGPLPRQLNELRVAWLLGPTPRRTGLEPARERWMTPELSRSKTSSCRRGRMP